MSAQQVGVSHDERHDSDNAARRNCPCDKPLHFRYFVEMAAITRLVSLDQVELEHPRPEQGEDHACRDDYYEQDGDT